MPLLNFWSILFKFCVIFWNLFYVIFLRHFFNPLDFKPIFAIFHSIVTETLISSLIKNFSFSPLNLFFLLLVIFMPYGYGQSLLFLTTPCPLWVHFFYFQCMINPKRGWLEYRDPVWNMTRFIPAPVTDKPKRLKIMNKLFFLDCEQMKIVTSRKIYVGWMYTWYSFWKSIHHSLSSTPSRGGKKWETNL